MDNATCYRVCLSKTTRYCNAKFIPEIKRNAVINFRDANFKQLLTRPTLGKDLSGQRGFFSRNCHYRGNYFQNTKTYPWLFQATRHNRCKLVRAQKTSSGGPVEGLQSFTAQHVLAVVMVRAVGGDARKYNICCSRRFDNSATDTCLHCPKALRRDLPTAFARHENSTVHKYKLRDLCQCVPTCEEHEQD